MRNAPIARLLVATSAVCAVGVWAACGGSDDQDIVQTDSGVDTGNGGGPDGNDAPPDTGRPRDSGPADAVADVKVYDAGAPNVLDGGDIEGGIPCVVGGALELESNDSRELAIELAPTRCGVVRVGVDGGDGGESDFLTFTLADASASFYVQYAGNVKVLIETDGAAPVDITEGSPVLAFRKGQPYFVEVKSKDGKQQVWRVTLFQE
jgi:hypothetical protein